MDTQRTVPRRDAAGEVSAQDEMESRLISIIRSHLPARTADTGTIEITDDLRGLGLDSIASVELLIELESAFDVRFPDDLLTLTTVSTPAHLLDAIWRVKGGP